MNTETKNRLIGLNSLLADLFEEEVLISHILEKSGFTDAQIEKIRISCLDIFLNKVCHNLYHYISRLLPERYAKVIKFCYYLDGKRPNKCQGDERKSKVAERRIYQQQSEAISSLRDKNRLRVFKRIFITSAKDALKTKDAFKAKDVLKHDKQNFTKCCYYLDGKKEFYTPPERPAHLLSESNKARQLKKAYKRKRVPARVIDNHKPKRKIFNPWLGSDRYKGNWW